MFGVCSTIWFSKGSLVTTHSGTTYDAAHFLGFGM